MKNKILLIGLVLITLLPVCYAAQQSLGTFKQNSCVNLIQSCASCTYVNFTAYYPNTTILISNEETSSVGGGIFSKEVCNTTSVGQYIVTGIGDVSGVDTIFSYDFEINSVGYERDSGNFGVGVGIILIGITALFIILAAVTRESRIWSIFFLLFALYSYFL